MFFGFWGLSGPRILLRRVFFFPSSRYGRKILVFSGCRGGKNLGFQKSHECKKMTSAAEGDRKNLQNQDFSRKMTSFGAFQNFRDVRFGTFSISTGVSFGEKEISTDVRFRDFFGGKIRRRGVKKTTPKGRVTIAISVKV